MEPIRVRQVVERDGEVLITGLPFKKGQQVDLVVLIEPTETSGRPPLTARALLDSGLVGLWEDRTDIGDVSGYARRLREQAQRQQVSA